MLNEVATQPPQEADLIKLSREYPEIGRWIRLVQAALPRVNSYEVSVDVTSVAANSESVETVTVNGLVEQDVMLVNKPTNTAGLDLVQAWAGTDTLSLKFRNVTGSPIDPGIEIYRVISFRL